MPVPALFRCKGTPYVDQPKHQTKPQVAVDCAAQAFASGRERVRIDFDTTAGDLTYTTLKNSLPLVRYVPACCRHVGGNS